MLASELLMESITHLWLLCTENQRGLMESLGQAGTSRCLQSYLLLKGSRLSSDHVACDFVQMGLEILQGADLFLVTSTCIPEGCIEVLHQVTLSGCFGLRSQVGCCCTTKHLGSIIYIQKLPLLLGHVFLSLMSLQMFIVNGEDVFWRLEETYRFSQLDLYFKMEKI